MDRYEDVKLDDEMYSVVFGLGKVIFVLAKSLRLDGYYVFEVEYENGQRVYYTEDGRPSWCRDMNKCTKTVYYKSEVNFNEVDTSSESAPMTKFKIEKLRFDDALEMKSPAGAWIDATLMPDVMVDNAINNEEYHLFRQKKSKNKA